MERFELAKRKPTLEHLSIFPLTGAEVEDLMRWSRLSEQIFRVAKWRLRRDYAAMRVGSEVK
jgi:hypothetical protein